MRGLKALIVGGVLALGSFVTFSLVGLSTDAQAASCSGNSIINCGFSSLADFRAKYKQNATGDLDNIYNHYNMPASVINGANVKNGTVYRNGDITVDGAKVATGAQSLGRHYLSGSSTLKIDGKTYYQRSTTVSMVSHSSEKVLVYYDKSGNFIAAVMYECGNPVIAKPTPKPVYTCDSLTATKITRESYKFTTQATVKNGATAYNYTYDFGDGTSKTTGASVTHTYAKPGTYTAKVTFKAKLPNGSVVSAPIGNCVVKVTVAVEPCPVKGKEHLPKDSPECVEDKPSVSIVKTVNGQEDIVVKPGELFTYKIVVTNTGNVALKDAVVTDPAPTGVTLVSAPLGTVSENSWTYTIASLAVGESKEFTIQAKMPAYVTGNALNKVCVETPTVPGGNPDACDTASTSTEKEDVPVPVELPRTGLGDGLTAMAGLGAMTGTAYHYGMSRRNLRKAMLKE